MFWAKPNSPFLHQGARPSRKILGLKFHDGVWMDEARSVDDMNVYVRVDSHTGEVFPDKHVPQLSDADIRAHLSTQGYAHAHDADFKEGVWMIKADTPASRSVNLPLEPQTGRMIGTDRHGCGRWEVAAVKARAMHHFRRHQVRRERRT